MISRQTIGRAVALVMLAVLLPLAAFAAEPAGSWEGKIELPGLSLKYTVDFALDSAGAWIGTIDIPDQGAKGLPLKGILARPDSLHFAIAEVPGDPTFHGAFGSDGKELSGTFMQNGQSFPFAMTRIDSALTAARSAELDESLAKIRAFIDTTIKEFRTPGLALAIIKDDQVIMSEGFGLRNVEQNFPVTAQTLFPIGSSTKAFTTCALAMLADSGKIDWNGKVIEYLPEFRLKDPYITSHATIRDLVTHRIGLPRHDLMWYGSPYSREEMLRRLQYLDFSEDFRTAFQYQNLMFMTAGYLAGKVAGTSWEEFVKSRIFTALGMANTSFTIKEMQQSAEWAQGYRDSSEQVVLMPCRDIEAIGPAGSINSSVEQMANWVRLHLNRGELNGSRIVSEGQMLELHSPNFVFDRAGGPHTEHLLSSYGLGWFIEAYRGHYRVHHGGNIDGYSALVSFLPDDRIGMVILTNQNASPSPALVCSYVSDVLLGLEPVDFAGRLRTALASSDNSKVDPKEAAADRVANTKPSHDLKAYAGEFEHPGYGVIRVTVDNKQLQATLHDLKFGLEHWHYDIFRLLNDLFGGEEARMFLSFLTNTQGDIDRLSLTLEQSLPPMEFTRRPDRGLFDPAYLVQFVGKYASEGPEVSIDIQSDHLTLTVPGQPTYVLEPYRTDEFNIKDLTGFSLAFERSKDGVVIGVKFRQPNGVFSAQKKSV